MKYLELEIYNLRIQFVVAKLTHLNLNLNLKSKSLRRMFRFIFQFGIYILKESSKPCLIFFYFFVILEKSANISNQELSFNHILKYLISKYLQRIRKKADTVLISVYSSCTAENFKEICNAFGT